MVLCEVLVTKIRLVCGDRPSLLYLVPSFQPHLAAFSPQDDSAHCVGVSIVLCSRAPAWRSEHRLHEQSACGVGTVKQDESAEDIVALNVG